MSNSDFRALRRDTAGSNVSLDFSVEEEAPSKSVGKVDYMNVLHATQPCSEKKMKQ